MATALRQITECPVCFLHYENPKVLPCDHSLCACCVDRVKTESRIKCPICNATHDVTRVRADFRLHQFLEALKEKEQDTVSFASTDETAKCDVCNKQPLSHRCEDCRQRLCTHCKTIHQRNAANKNHKMRQITITSQEIKRQLRDQFSNIKRKMKKQSKIVEKLRAEIRKLEKGQSKALKKSDKLRQASLKEINDHFDSIDAEIIDFMHAAISKLQIEQKKLSRQKRDVTARFEQLQQMLKENEILLDDERNSILQETFKLSEASCVDVYITEVDFTLVQEDEWNVSKSATLSLAGGDIEVCRDEANQLSFTTSLDKSFMQQKQVNLERLPYALRLIRGQLWSCERDGTVQVFSQELELQSTLASDNWADVCDVTEISNGEVVLAGQNGLFHITSNGAASEIDAGKYNSVTSYDNSIYAYAWGPPRVCIYELSQNEAWVKRMVLQLPFQYDTYVTLSVMNDVIHACSAADARILTLSVTGQLLQSLGENGLGISGKLSYPRLCQEDEEGSLLIAAKNDHHLQIVDREGEWRMVGMSPVVNKICDAVYTDGKLYVASRGRGFKLSLYTNAGD